MSADKKLRRIKTLDEVSPSSNEECPCGSGKTFSICCEALIHPEIDSQLRSLIDNEQYLEALPACRAYLCRYLLCHKAHTIPMLRQKTQLASKLLLADIETLFSILQNLQTCYRENGIINDFPRVLDSMQDRIDDVRWRDKLSLLRSIWYRIDKSDSPRAKECFDGIDMNRCEDPSVIAGFLLENAWDLTFNKRMRLCERVCKFTDDESIRLQFRILQAFSSVLIFEETEASTILKIAISNFEKLEPSKKSLFGKHLYAHSLDLLGNILQDDSLVRKAVESYDEFLRPPCELTFFGIADYRLWMGRCYAFLGDYDQAIRNYLLSIEANSVPLAQIFLAEALISKDKIPQGREILASLNPAALSQDNLQDFIVAKTLLAIASKLPKDIEAAKHALKAYQSNLPYFAYQKSRLEIALLETSPTQSMKSLKGIMRMINRYFEIKPNIAGIGLNLNAILDRFEDDN